MPRVSICLYCITLSPKHIRTRYTIAHSYQLFKSYDIRKSRVQVCTTPLTLTKITVQALLMALIYRFAEILYRLFFGFPDP